MDARSDIFSFGSVLYEMATADRAFSGSSSIAIAARILGEEPVPPQRQPGTDLLYVNIEVVLLRPVPGEGDAGIFWRQRWLDLDSRKRRQCDRRRGIVDDVLRHST